MSKQKTLTQKDLILVFALYCGAILLIPFFSKFDPLVLISGVCFGSGSMFFFGRARRPIERPASVEGAAEASK
jgi:hypothetical protein